MAITSLSGSVSAGSSITYSSTNDGFMASVRFPFNFQLKFASTDKAWSQERTIAPDSEDIIVLSSAFDDRLSGTFAFRNIKCRLIINNDPEITITVSGSGGDEYVMDDYVNVGPGDCFLLTSQAGNDVLHPLSDHLVVLNPGATAVTYEILLVGAPA